VERVDGRGVAHDLAHHGHEPRPRQGRDPAVGRRQRGQRHRPLEPPQHLQPVAREEAAHAVGDDVDGSQLARAVAEAARRVGDPAARAIVPRGEAREPAPLERAPQERERARAAAVTVDEQDDRPGGAGAARPRRRKRRHRAVERVGEDLPGGEPHARGHLSTAFCATPNAVIPYFTLADKTIYLGPVPIQWFGILVATGVILGVNLTRRRAKKLGYDADKLESFIWWMLACGFVVSHMFDVIVYYPETLVTEPWKLLFIWQSLSSFGGFLGAIIGNLLWKRFKGRGQPILAFSDLILSVFPIAWTFGRIGCTVVHD